MKRAVIIVIGVFVFIIACSKKTDSLPSDCTTTKSFSSDVNPIIQTTCAINAGCHASGSTNGPGPLTNHAQVFSARTSIKVAVANGTMPQNSTLSTTQKNAIICWIDSGAPNN
jgi:hypothetical protein